MLKPEEKSPIETLDSLKLHVISHAESLDAARDNAYKSIMENPTKHTISEAIDYYHNTVIETVSDTLKRTHDAA
ncbi:MAG: hypothetical protein AXW14_08575 [Alteromonas sp. Nap_26]|nr:MAG: hypothetical protein AXW14_08575 [Alteromonas sp. Nap_26]